MSIKEEKTGEKKERGKGENKKIRHFEPVCK
jgi:hypothetical protein